MRDKNLLHLFLVLNLALGGCFVVYLLLSAHQQPKVTTAAFTAQPEKTNSFARPVVPPPSATPASSNGPAVTPAPAALTTNNLPAPVFTQKKFTADQVETDDYKTYLASLRGVGCPENRVRDVALADIRDHFDKLRIAAAQLHDTKWWRAELDYTFAAGGNVLQEKGRQLEEQRRVLIEKLLGADALEQDKTEALLWSSVQLTGPVLGALTPELHNTVQEICSRSLDRHQGAFWARINEGQQPTQMDMARLREQTRSDLRKVLNAEQLEEFLLRYSHNALGLRNEMRGFEPAPDEFRKAFRAIDPLDHQLQNEYGGVEALSQQQRERYERQRDAAIREAIGPKRYQDYLLVKDPAFRQAQATAQQYGAPTRAIFPIYQSNKALEARRQQIMADAGLTPEQKQAALNTVNQEQIRSIQQIVSDAAAPR